MNKDKVITWVITAVLLGGAIKMVRELQVHGDREKLIGDAEVIEE